MGATWKVKNHSLNEQEYDEYRQYLLWNTLNPLERVLENRRKRAERRAHLFMNPAAYIKAEMER